MKGPGGYDRLTFKGDMSMPGIIDRFLMLVCCAALLAGTADDIAAVAAILAAITVSALNGYTRSGLLVAASLLLYTAAGAFWPAFCLFLPLVYYDAPAGGPAPRRTAGIIAAAASLLLPFVYLPVDTSLMVAALMAVSCVLALRTAEAERSRIGAGQLRDISHEAALLLREKNRELIERQDYEIRLATLNERGRIAREIHDHVGHMLSRSILQVGALMVTASGAEEKENLSTVHETLSEAMDRIRESVHDLHSESIDLRTRIEALAGGFTFCPIQLRYALESEPDSDIACCFIAVAGEGLSNIIRHSGATRVILALLEHPALYQLVLQDNGSAVSREPGKGLGLQSMAHRVEELGGRFSVEQSGGFRLFVSLPKRRAAHESAAYR